MINDTALQKLNSTVKNKKRLITAYPSTWFNEGMKKMVEEVLKYE